MTAPARIDPFANLPLRPGHPATNPQGTPANPGTDPFADLPVSDPSPDSLAHTQEQHDSFLQGLKFLITHPSVIWEGIKSSAKDVAAFGSFVQPRMGRIMASPVSGALEAMMAAREFIQLQQTNPEQAKQVQNGFALTMSMAPGLAITKIPGAISLLGKAGAFLAGEAAAGGVYGATNALEEGQTRTGSMAQNAAMFPVMGLVGKGVGRALGMAGRPIARAITNAAAKETTVPLDAAAQATLDKATWDAAKIDPLLDHQAISLEQASATPEESSLEHNARSFNARVGPQPTSTLRPEITGLQGPRNFPGFTPEKPTLQPPTPPIDPSLGFQDISGGQASAQFPGEEIHPRQFNATEGTAGSQPQPQITGLQASAEHPELSSQIPRANPYAFPGWIGATDAATTIRDVASDKSEPLSLGPKITEPGSAPPPGNNPVNQAKIQAASGGAPTINDLAIAYSAAQDAVRQTPLQDLVNPRTLDRIIKLVQPGLDQVGARLPMAEVETTAAEAGVSLPKSSGVPRDLALKDPLPEKIRLMNPGLETLGVTGTDAALLSEALARPNPLNETGEQLPEALFDNSAREINTNTTLERKEIANTFQRMQNADPGQRLLKILNQPSQDIRPPWTPAGMGREAPKGDLFTQIARLTNGQQQLLGTIANQSGKAAVPAMLGVTGGGMLYLGQDENLSPQARNTLTSVGRLLVAGAALSSPTLRQWFTSRNFGRAILQSMNALDAIDIYHPDASRFVNHTVVGPMAAAEAYAGELAAKTRELFPDRKFMQDVASYAADEGERAPEWGMLNSEQQDFLRQIQTMHSDLGTIGTSEGFMKGFRENYLRQFWPKESAAPFGVAGNSPGSLAPGGFVKPRAFDTLRQATQWATDHRVQGPNQNLDEILASHYREWNRAAIINRLVGGLDERFGAIVDGKDLRTTPGINGTTQFSKIPEGMREIRVKGYEGQYTHSDFAALLEHLAGTDRFTGVPGAIIQKAQAFKATQMRISMLFPWEHGLNVLRGAATLANGLNPVKWADLLGRVNSGTADAMTRNLVNHGFMFGSGDYAPADPGLLSKAIDGMVQRGGVPGAATSALLTLHKAGEDMLMRKLVPALGILAGENSMRDWVERTGGKFGEDTPEWHDALFQAAKWANAQSGQVPKYLSNPGLTQAFNSFLFAPNWFRTRAQLWLGQTSDLGKVASGQQTLGDSPYLKQKLRIIALGTAVTYLGSLMMSGKPPGYNPNSGKFYMRTGLKNQTGQELGVDLGGWWQDDLHFTKDWNGFMFARANPILTQGYRFLSSTNYLGQSVSHLEAFEGAAKGIGGPAWNAMEWGAGTLGGGIQTPGEHVQMASRALGVGSVATLPRPIDLVSTKIAEKLLNNLKLGTGENNVTDLSRLVRANLIQGRSPIDGPVEGFLGAVKRNQAKVSPFTSIWRGGLRALGHALRNAGTPSTEAPSPIDQGTPQTPEPDEPPEPTTP